MAISSLTRLNTHSVHTAGKSYFDCKAKEPPKENPKEHPKESLRNPIRSPYKEPPKELPKEPPKELPKEPPKEPPKEDSMLSESDDEKIISILSIDSTWNEDGTGTQSYCLG